MKSNQQLIAATLILPQQTKRKEKAIQLWYSPERVNGVIMYLGVIFAYPETLELNKLVASGESIMQKWEYLFVYVGDAGNCKRPYKINDVEIEGWRKGPDMITYCNQLGAEGWEMISFNVSQSGTVIIHNVI